MDITTISTAEVRRAALAGAMEALHITPEEYRRLTTDYYRNTEGLLRAYRKIKFLHDNPEEYQFFPTEHSHDISVSPARGTSYRDKTDVLEEHVERRKRSFVRTMTAFYSIRAAILAERENPKFITVAMYYLNEDAEGNDRGDDAERLTWEDISIAIEDATGEYYDAKTLSRWRSEIIREMAILIYGVDAALSLSMGSPRDDLEEADDLQEGGGDDEPI